MSDKDKNSVPKKSQPITYSPKARAKKGNTDKVKFPNPEDRQKCHDEYCEHLKQGFSKQSFEGASPKTMTKYIKQFPEDFPIEEIEAALRVGRYEWEKIGMDQAKGINGGNGSTWFRIMQNQYDYRDRLDLTSKDNELGTAPIDMSKLGDDQLEQLAALLSAAEADDDVSQSE